MTRTDSLIDLHIHTTMSDGQYTPAEIAALASGIGVAALSITDHDTISGTEEGAAASFKAGISFVPGIEISVKGNRELHILGYCIDIHNKRLKEMCESFETLRRERQARIFRYLRERGVLLTEEQVERHAAHGRIGRPHFASAMLEAGYVGTLREAFDRYLATPEFDGIERPKPSPEDGISVIREAGGVAVLAHPVQLKLENDELETLLRELMGFGLRGIECYYSTHTAEQTAFYLSLAEKYKLTVTGGSDFHGEKIKPDIKIGTGIQNSLCFRAMDIVQKLKEAAVSD